MKYKIETRQKVTYVSIISIQNWELDSNFIEAIWEMNGRGGKHIIPKSEILIISKS